MLSATSQARQADKASTWTVRIVCNGMYEWPRPHNITITRSEPFYTQLQRALPITLDPKTVRVACSKQAKVIVVAVAVTSGDVCPTTRHPVSHALLNLPDLKFTRMVSGRQTWRVRILCKGTTSSHEIAALLHLDVEVITVTASAKKTSPSEEENDARILGLMRFLRTFTNTTPQQFMKDYRVRVAWNSSEQVVWLYVTDCERSEHVRQLPTMPIRETSSSRSAIAQIISGVAGVGLLGLVIWRHGGDLMQEGQQLHSLRVWLKRIQKRLRMKVAQYARQIANATSDLQVEVANVNNIARPVEQKTRESITLQQLNDARGALVGALDMEMKHLEQQLQSAEAEYKSNVETWQSKLNMLTDVQAKLQEQLREAQTDREKQSQLHQSTVEQLQSLTQQSTAKTQEIEQLQKAREQVLTELRASKLETEIITAAAREKLAISLKQKEEELQMLKQQHDKEVNELQKKHNHENLLYQTNLERLRENESATRTEIQGLKSEIANNQKEAQQHAAQETHYQQQIRETETRIQSLTTAEGAQQKEIETLQLKIKQIQQQAKEHETERQQLEQKIKEQEKQIKNSERNLATMKSERTQIQTQHTAQQAEAKVQLNKLTADLEQEKQARYRQVEEQRRQTAQLEQLAQQKSALEGQLRNAQSQHAAIQAQLTQQRAETERQTQALRERSVALENLQNEAQAIKEKEHKFKETMAQLQEITRALETEKQNVANQLQITSTELQQVRQTAEQNARILEERNQQVQKQEEELHQANARAQSQAVALLRLTENSSQTKAELENVQHNQAVTCNHVITQAWKEINERFKTPPVDSVSTPGENETGLVKMVHELSVLIEFLPKFEAILTMCARSEQEVYNSAKQDTRKTWNEWTNGPITTIMKTATDRADDEVKKLEKNLDKVEAALKLATPRLERVDTQVRGTERVEPVRQMGLFKAEIATILGFPVDVKKSQSPLLQTAREGKLITELLFNFVPRPEEMKQARRRKTEQERLVDTWEQWAQSFQGRFDKAVAASKQIDALQSQARKLQDSLPKLELSLIHSFLEPQEKYLQFITTELAKKLPHLWRAETLHQWTEEIKQVDEIVEVFHTFKIGENTLLRILALREGLKKAVRTTIEREVQLLNMYNHIYAGEEDGLKLLQEKPESERSVQKLKLAQKETTTATDKWNAFLQIIDSDIKPRVATFGRPQILTLSKKGIKDEAAITTFLKDQREIVKSKKTINDRQENLIDLAILSMSRTGFQVLHDVQPNNPDYTAEWQSSEDAYKTKFDVILASLDNECTITESETLKELLDIATALTTYVAPISYDVQQELGKLNTILNNSLDNCSRKTALLSTVNTTLLRNAHEDVVLGQVRICARLNFVQPPLMPNAEHIATLRHSGNQPTIAYGDAQYGPFFTVFGEKVSNAALMKPGGGGKGLHSFFDQVRSGYRQVLFGYGASGSGKTYSLFGTSGTGSSIQIGAEAKGLVQAGLNYLGEKDCDVEIHSIFDILGFVHFPSGFIQENLIVWYAMEDKAQERKERKEGKDKTSIIYDQLSKLFNLHVDKFLTANREPEKINDLRTQFTEAIAKRVQEELAQKPQQQQQKQHKQPAEDTPFVKHFNILLDVLTERRLNFGTLRCTPTNPTSSRSQLLITFKVTNRATKLTGYLTVVDMAGAEDPFTIIQSFFQVNLYKTNQEKASGKTIDMKKIENTILLKEINASLFGQINEGLEVEYCRTNETCDKFLKGENIQYCVKDTSGKPIMSLVEGKEVCERFVPNYHTVPTELTCQAFYINESFHHLKKLLLAALGKEWTPPTVMILDETFTYDPHKMFQPERADVFLTVALKCLYDMEKCNYDMEHTENVKTTAEAEEKEKKTNLAQTKYVMLILVRTSPDNESREVFVKDTLDFAQFLLATGAAEKHGIAGEATSLKPIPSKPSPSNQGGFLTSLVSAVWQFLPAFRLSKS